MRSNEKIGQLHKTKYSFKGGIDKELENLTSPQSQIKSKEDQSIAIPNNQTLKY